MTIGCNIWMICLKLNRFFYGQSRMLQFSQLDATDRSKISSDQKRFFIALSLYLLSFFANTPFKSVPMSWKLMQVFIAGYGLFNPNISRTEME